MSVNLLKSRNALDKVMDAAYGYKGATSDAACIALLFRHYQQNACMIPIERTKKIA